MHKDVNDVTTFMFDDCLTVFQNTPRANITHAHDMRSAKKNHFIHNIICTYARIKLSTKATLPKTNNAPKNRPSERESSLPTTFFQG